MPYLKKRKNPGLAMDQSCNWSMAEDLSLHKIWFKSVNNILDILQTYRHGYYSTSATS